LEQHGTGLMDGAENSQTDLLQQCRKH
jgi:hypothetical protein